MCVCVCVGVGFLRAACVCERERVCLCPTKLSGVLKISRLITLTDLQHAEFEMATWPCQKPSTQTLFIKPLCTQHGCIISSHVAFSSQNVSKCVSGCGRVRACAGRVPPTYLAGRETTPHGSDKKPVFESHAFFGWSCYENAAYFLKVATANQEEVPTRSPTPSARWIRRM